MDALINWLNVWFGQKAPALPTKGKEFIVKVAPWLSIISIAISVPAILALMGLHASFSTSGMYGYGYSAGYWWIFSAAVIVLNILALKGLFKPAKSGWMFTFYAVLVGGLSSILMMDIIGAIISLAISFYLLFQIKPYYFGGAMMTQTVKPVPPTTPTV
jgi:hypothetical protein